VDLIIDRVSATPGEITFASEKSSGWAARFLRERVSLGSD
jgi:hypothetical protein